MNKVKNATTVNLLNRHTIANTNSRDSPQSDITILVPDLDRIGVRSPGKCPIYITVHNYMHLQLKL